MSRIVIVPADTGSQTDSTTDRMVYVPCPEIADDILSAWETAEAHRRGETVPLAEAGEQQQEAVKTE